MSAPSVETPPFTPTLTESFGNGTTYRLMIRAYGHSDFSKTENRTNGAAIQQGMHRRSDPQNVEETASKLKQGRLKVPEDLTPSPQLGPDFSRWEDWRKDGTERRRNE